MYDIECTTQRPADARRVDRPFVQRARARGSDYFFLLAAFSARHFAQRFLAASAMRWRPSADIVPFRRPLAALPLAAPARRPDPFPKAFSRAASSARSS